MEKVKVNLLKKVNDSYDITIGNNLFPGIVKHIASQKFGKVALVTDSTVKKLYGNKLLSMLKKKKIPAELFSFKAGEASKTRGTKEKLEDALTARRFGRDACIIALGGGVTGDLAGFIGATYMRSIPYIQVPTTLLAMVDSSIGGKTGVDTAFGKNLIGAFYQPKAVFIDTAVLKTLPKKELLNGIVEMAKHGIIADAEFFIFMRNNIENIYNLKDSVLRKAIKRSCEIKKNVVEKDEKESKLRKMLNFGHTIGHSIEKLSNYRMSHGNAVGVGIIIETRIAESLNMISPAAAREITGLMKKIGIKTKLTGMNAKAIVESSLYDKKNTAKNVNYVLPLKIGRVALDINVKNKVAVAAINKL